MRFSGIPNRFMITDRCASGMYFDRNVPKQYHIQISTSIFFLKKHIIFLANLPIEGKYMPTQASNTKKAAIKAGKLALPTNVAADNAAAAKYKTAAKEL